MVYFSSSFFSKSKTISWSKSIYFEVNFTVVESLLRNTILDSSIAVIGVVDLRTNASLNAKILPVLFSISSESASFNVLSLETNFLE